MSEERDAYQAFLLRLWRVPCRGRWQWRASLESSRTGERQLFAGLEQLFAFVAERCDEEDAETRGSGVSLRSTLEDSDAEMRGHGDAASQ